MIYTARPKKGLEKLKSVLKEARRYYNKEEFDESKRLFSEIAKIVKEYDIGMTLFERAFVGESWNFPGEAWNEIGITFHDIKEYDKAIVCYKKALKEETFSPGIIWNNIGASYEWKGEYDKAIECFKKGLKEEKYSPGILWKNMGFAYKQKRSYIKAFECYEKALEDENDDTPGLTYFFMAATYYDMEDYKNAIKYLEIAKENPPIKNDPKEIARINSMILIDKQKIRDPDSSLSSFDEAFTDSISPAMETMVKMGSPENLIQLKIQMAGEDIATRYSKTPKSKYDNVFVVLKGWSSATPLFGSHEGGLINECRGGGYFLKWQGKGIVVDPGLDFVRNFDEAGFNFREIDVVIVSHNHTDHNQDLRPIDDIMYELRRRSDHDVYNEIKYYLITDKDTKNSIKFDPPRAAHRKELKCFKIDGASPSKNKIDLRKEGKIPIVIKYFKAKHGGANHAVGIILDLYNDSMKKRLLSIGMSCDTEFFKGLCNKDKLGACDLLVAHISQPDSKELTDEKHFKKGHLGYRGTAKLIQNSGARLNLVSEFWGGKGDLRIELTQGLRQLCDDKMIFPGSIGCMVDLNSLKLQCTNCKNFISPGDIIIAPPISTLGRLQYLCSNCRV